MTTTTKKTTIFETPSDIVRHSAISSTDRTLLYFQGMKLSDIKAFQSSHTLSVRTYSPLFGISPATRHLAHRTAPTDHFDMVVE